MTCAGKSSSVLTEAKRSLWETIYWGCETHQFDRSAYFDENDFLVTQIIALTFVHNNTYLS
ncbi:hypothetical protein Pla22_31710 [Rubripirellula amarantea]|uniref:Uncharacterized protein n=1 Tax=Rubripirellula amarantea TaxID=2527999 RepID=A0A5C5WI71_9BACT|nr:hypothetical protein Pla22_31710 [Rubripirellula amarantea]